MDSLPETSAAWSQAMAQHNLTGRSIQVAGLRSSASKISIEQFLLLRVLWLERKQAHKFEAAAERGRWIFDNHLDTARSFLKQLPAWKAYIASFAESEQILRDTRFAGLDSFTLARLYQLNVGGLEELSTGPVSISKLDVSPIATRTRSQTSRQLASSNPAGQVRPYTPTPGPRSRPDLGTTFVHDDELPVGAPEVEDEDEDEASLEERVGNISLSTSAPSSHHISPLSPFTGDFARNLKAVSDEQIVNMALIVCLNTLTVHCPGLKVDWSPERRAFTVKDRKQLKVYEARVDGYLRRSDRKQEALAIIEAKPFARGSNLAAIRMQEGAQMAAWISHQPPSPSELEKSRNRPDHQFSRLLVSQDRDEIFLTFACFNAEYVAYICDTVAEAEAEAQVSSFLEMQEYGPFDTASASHMRGFGELVLAFCLQSSNGGEAST